MWRAGSILIGCLFVATFMVVPSPPSADAAAHSLDDLENLTMEIASDAPSWASQGIQLVRWGPAPSSDLVEISLAIYTEEAASALVNYYGPDWVSVDTQSLGPATPVLDRFTDTSPFFGGDWIWGTVSGTTYYCTSGSNLVSNSSSQTYALTAGHCYAKGTTVYTNTSTKKTMGTVSNRVLGGGSIDAELIPTKTQPYIWGNSGTLYGVNGDIDVGVGGTVCFDGAKTGENCNDAVSQHDICIQYTTGQYVCHVSEAVNSNHTVCQGGDSGGPVYKKTSGGTEVNVAGEVVAYNTVHDCYYAILGYVESYFGAHIQHL